MILENFLWVPKKRFLCYDSPRRGWTMAEEELTGENWRKFGGIRLVEEGEKRQVLVGDHVCFRWDKSDEAGQRTAIAQLYELGMGTQEEIANAFDIHVNSVYNYINAWRADGIPGLVSKQRGPKGSWKVNRELKGKIILTTLRFDLDGYQNIQNKLKEVWNIEVSIETIRQVLIESGLINSRGRMPVIEGPDFFDAIPPDKDQLEFKLEFNDRSEETVLEALEKKEEVKESSPDTKRWLSSYSKAERTYLNELERGIYNVYAGGLLFVPLLRRYKFLETIKEIIDIRLEDGYTLDQLCLTLFYFDLFQFRSIENFKSSYPEEFGILSGRLSSPSIRTLWRFMGDAANLEKGEELAERFAKLYLSSGLTKWGVLYIDEHLVPYYGRETVSMGYHTVRQMPLKGSYSYAALDENFNALLYLLRSSSERIVTKIPEIIIKAKKIAKKCKENPDDLVIVFDRGGYSAKLFRELAKLKVRYITWAKYFDKWVNDIEESKFDKTTNINYVIQGPDKIKYFELERKVRKYGAMRTIAIQSGLKKQRAAIYTNDNSSSAERIIQLICRRWGQENWNKTMKLEHRIDYSPGYEFEDIYEQPMVENPEVKKLKQEKSKLYNRFHSLKIEFADSLLKQKSELDWEKIKKKKLEIRADMEIIQSKIFSLTQEIDKLPKEVSYDQAHGERLVKFNYERKRFLDSIKVFVYAMEKKMCELSMNYHGKVKEAWPIMGMIFKRGAIVKLENDRLLVKLRRFKNPAVDYVARHLCEDLNSMRPVTMDKYRFPIRYQVL